MKRIRFSGALLTLALALGFALASGPSSSATEESCPPCTCYYPNGDYGIKVKDDCEVKCCSIPIIVE